MARRFDSPRRATLIGVLALALLGFALFLLLGDDGSEPERQLERSAIRIDSGETPAPAEAASPAAAPGNGSKAPAKTEDAGTARAGSQQRSAEAERRDEPSPPSEASGVACPPEISREECELLAAAAANGDSSVAIRKPRDCLKIMTRAECIELLRDQKAAAAQGENSYSLEDCLNGDAPREPCEEYAEQMREASQ